LVGGRQSTASGIEVCHNIPTFEVFTTPDWRGTEGTVGLTRPVMINGTLVEGLWLRFAAGELVEVRAERNLAAYEALINTRRPHRQEARRSRPGGGRLTDFSNRPHLSARPL